MVELDVVVDALGAEWVQALQRSTEVREVLTGMCLAV